MPETFGVPCSEDCSHQVCAIIRRDKKRADRLALSNVAELRAELRSMIDASALVVNRWESGDLAGAVNNLEGSADSARELLKRIQKPKGTANV